GRVKASDRVRRPHDELLNATCLDDDGSAIGRPIRERLPAQLTGLAIQRNDARVRLASGAHDQKIAHDERRRAGSVTRNLAVEIFGQIPFPNELTPGRAEANEMALRAERVNLAVVDSGRRAWTVAVFHVLVVGRIGMRPKQLARGFVEAHDALD